MGEFLAICWSLLVSGVALGLAYPTFRRVLRLQDEVADLRRQLDRARRGMP